VRQAGCDPVVDAASQRTALPVVSRTAAPAAAGSLRRTQTV